MEHLFFQPDESHAHEFVFVSTSEVLSTDWDAQTDLIDFIHPRTPYLGFDHDNDKHGLVQFAEYPASRGFDISKIWNGELRASSPTLLSLEPAQVGLQVASLLQAWLYFGLLETVLATRVNISYLTRNHTDGKVYLYTRNLEFCLNKEFFEDLTWQEKAQIGAIINDQLSLVHDWINRIVGWGHEAIRPKFDDRHPGFVQALEEVVPAIVRLAEMVSFTRINTFSPYIQPGVLSWLNPFLYMEHRKSQLKNLGWCKFQIQMIEHTLNQSTVDWLVASNLHQDPTGHESCTETDCVRNNVDATAYQQAHVCDDGNCEKIFPDLQKVMDILKSNQIPVMCFTMDHEQPSLDVSARSKAVRGDYMAVSHVWVDGLGGATERGLNRCQVEKISNLCSSAQQFGGKVFFWLDSLCIPKVDRDVHIAALVGIRDVYLNASSVLVIDRMIQQCSTSDSPGTLYARIHLSGWMQRMWTYEEAVLGKKLIFALRDGFHSAESSGVWPELTDKSDPIVNNLGPIMATLRTTDASQLHISDIHRAFRYRLTNARQEEFLSVSGILGLDTARLLKSKGEERTKNFWLMLKTLPFNVMFADGPKLSIPGFRWAPSTLMTPAHFAMGVRPKDNPECTPEGLIGTYRLAKLDKALSAPWDGLYHVSVDPTDDPSARNGDRPAFLSMQCYRWSDPPNGPAFDHILILSEGYTVPVAGTMNSAVALLKENSSMTTPTGVNRTEAGTGGGDEDDIEKYHYMGVISLERVADSEVSSSSPTVMFQGNSALTINAKGTWIKAKICIT